MSGEILKKLVKIANTHQKILNKLAQPATEDISLDDNNIDDLDAKFSPLNVDLDFPLVEEEEEFKESEEVESILREEKLNKIRSLKQKLLDNGVPPERIKYIIINHLKKSGDW